MTNTSSHSKSAEILLAHGSKDPRWKKPFEEIISMAQKQYPEKIFRLCYLEACDPKTEDTVETLTQNHLDLAHITIRPLFLSQGKHFHRDIVGLTEMLQSKYPQVSFELDSVIGENPLVKDAIVKIITN